MTATLDDHELDDDERDRDPAAMFSLLQTLAIVLVAVVLTVGVTLLLTEDDPGDFNHVDVGFLTDMTTHHQGAITLGFEYLPNENDSIVGHTAREVILTQSQEIATMNNLLAEAGDAADAFQDDDVAMEWMGDPVDPADMPGMATGPELEALAAAIGVAADDLFTQLMIEHHAAGAEMAEYEAEHGENETVRSFAAKVARIQRVEIAELNERRVALGLQPIDVEPAGSDHGHS